MFREESFVLPQCLSHPEIYINSTVVRDFPPPVYPSHHDRPVTVTLYLVCPSKIDTHFVGMFPATIAIGLFSPNLYQLLGQHSIGVFDWVSWLAYEMLYFLKPFPYFFDEVWTLTILFK